MSLLPREWQRSTTTGVESARPAEAYPVQRWYSTGDSCDYCYTWVLYWDDVPGRARWRRCPACGALWEWREIPDVLREATATRRRGEAWPGVRPATHAWVPIQGGTAAVLHAVYDEARREEGVA